MAKVSRPYLPEQHFLLPPSLRECLPGFPLLVRSDAAFARSELVRFFWGKKIAAFLLFAGNPIRQPAYDNVADRAERKLANGDLLMNRLLWIGVYPDLTGLMLEYMHETIHAAALEFPALVKSGAK